MARCVGPQTGPWSRLRGHAVPGERSERRRLRARASVVTFQAHACFPARRAARDRFLWHLAFFTYNMCWKSTHGRSRRAPASLFFFNYLKFLNGGKIHLNRIILTILSVRFGGGKSIYVLCNHRTIVSGTLSSARREAQPTQHALCTPRPPAPGTHAAPLSPGFRLFSVAPVSGIIRYRSLWIGFFRSA